MSDWFQALLVREDPEAVGGERSLEGLSEEEIREGLARLWALEGMGKEYPAALLLRIPAGGAEGMPTLLGSVSPGEEEMRERIGRERARMAAEREAERIGAGLGAEGEQGAGPGGRKARGL